MFERYAQRLRPRLALIQIAEARGSPPEIKRREAALLLAALPAHAFVVALDQGAAAPTSEALARTFTGWIERGRPVCFVIGGAEGLDAAVLAASHHALSLGPLTWPHMLVRVMLAEQLYRAQSIAAGHPYHRAGRP